jgi:hypothetical protein
MSWKHIESQQRQRYLVMRDPRWHDPDRESGWDSHACTRVDRENQARRRFPFQREDLRRNPLLAGPTSYTQREEKTRRKRPEKKKKQQYRTPRAVRLPTMKPILPTSARRRLSRKRITSNMKQSAGPPSLNALESKALRTRGLGGLRESYDPVTMEKEMGWR